MLEIYGWDLNELVPTEERAITVGLGEVLGALARSCGKASLSLLSTPNGLKTGQPSMQPNTNFWLLINCNALYK